MAHKEPHAAPESALHLELVDDACGAFIEGNHEDHGALEALADSYADVVTHLKRGEVVDVAGCRTLCVGGARYMDAWSTPPGCEISVRDVATAVDRVQAGARQAIDDPLRHDLTGAAAKQNSQ